MRLNECSSEMIGGPQDRELLDRYKGKLAGISFSGFKPLGLEKRASEAELAAYFGAGDLTYPADAACLDTDPESFYPDSGDNARVARRVCKACPVRAECLQDALDRDEQRGIWGGLSERGRRKLKKRAV